jgi:hypothetical protein
MLDAKKRDERNKEIAYMFGWKRHDHASYFTWTKPEKPNEHFYEGVLQFHSNWNWLMDAVEFIKTNLRLSSDTNNPKIGEYFIDEWDFKVRSYYVRLIQWTKNGWRMFDTSNRDLSIYYLVGENCNSEKEAVFLIVSDFAKLYNEKKL